jgi:5-methylthioribose kinase
LDRIFREIGVMRLLAPLVPPGVVPRVLFEDRENYLFAMEAFDPRHVVWKQALLRGEADPAIADRLGSYLAAAHRGTAFQPELRQAWGDTEVFWQLRTEPFYLRLAQRHPELQQFVDDLVDEMARHSLCLVLADFSPKNILVSGPNLALVDFETGHYGDPAFDLGFFLSHLLLKTVRHAERFGEYAGLTVRFWQAYRAGLGLTSHDGRWGAPPLESRALSHLALCMWARIDGTSKIDYLPDGPSQNVVRDFCRSLIADRPANWDGVLERLRQGIEAQLPTHSRTIS